MGSGKAYHLFQPGMERSKLGIGHASAEDGTLIAGNA